MDLKMNSLFVYGTLRPNQPNAHVMENIGGTWQAGYILGTLENVGWGAELGSPGIHLNANGERVNGYIFSSDHLAQHWSYLDEFEGNEYQRVSVQVFLEDDSTVESLVYVLKTK